MEINTVSTSTTRRLKQEGLLVTLRRDVDAALQRDPAARSAFEVVLSYPGLHALWGYRMAHWMWQHNLKLLGRLLSQWVRSLTGIEIQPGALIGQ